LCEGETIWQSLSESGNLLHPTGKEEFEKLKSNMKWAEKWAALSQGGGKGSDKGICLY